jgi:hypothetical protein
VRRAGSRERGQNLQSVRSDSHGSSDRRGRPRRRSERGSESRSSLAESGDTSPTDHIYSSRSRMERAREQEREREAAPTVQGPHSGAQRRQASRSSRRDQREDAELRSREDSSDDDRDLRDELEGIRDEISRFLNGGFERRGGFRLGAHDVEVYRPRGRRVVICVVM